MIELYCPLCGTKLANWSDGDPNKFRYCPNHDCFQNYRIDLADEADEDVQSEITWFKEERS